MATDVNKHLDRGKRFLEKNKLQDAVTEYQAVLEAMPSHSEALQSLADIYIRLNDPGRAAHYYGLQFDRLVEAGDEAKAAALYARLLKAVPQPPERLTRYAFLLQKQNKVSAAIECYTTAAARFQEQRRAVDALSCLEKMAQLDPENSERHLRLASLAESVGKADVAARGYLRAGRLTLATGELDRALELLDRAHRLVPEDRTATLFFAEARLRKGDAAGAVALLEPFSPNETDTAFLALLGEALLRGGQLDRARVALEAYYRLKPDNFAKLFELAGAYLKQGPEERALEVLAELKEWLFGLRLDAEFAAQVDRLCESYPASVALATFSARLYEELNREAKYFDALVHLFDLHLEAGRLAEACDALDRLVDIDPYDYRNHQRIAHLEGKVDPAYLRSVMGRAAKAAMVFARSEEVATGAAPGGESVLLAAEEVRAHQALDDLMVQAEIFLQYSLHAKAIERLERLAELFPGEEETNERLRGICERANWWPKRGPSSPRPAAQQEVSASRVGGYSAETHRDLAAIAGISQLMYRQATPREVLAVAIQGINSHLAGTRCLAVLGPPGEPSQMAAEFSVPGLEPAGAQRSAAILKFLSITPPDSLGGIELRGNTVPALRELGLQTALGVQLTDKETQAAAGLLLVGDAAPRKWKPNESFFLQSIGDQLILCANHTRLRSLVRNLAVADEKTGLLSRGAYLDCLLAETKRAKSQGMPLSLVILQVDRGPELLRHFGEAPLEHFLEQLARVLESSARQGDLAVKYTASSIAFILPDTPLENARIVAEKLRQVAGSVRPPWGQPPVTLSAVVAEASRRQEDESEDRVTEWINRAESGVEEARLRGGDIVLSLEAPDLGGAPCSRPMSSS